VTVRFFNSTALASDLAHNRVTERESLAYMLIGAVLYTQANYFALWFGAYRDWLFFLELAVVLGVSLIGVHECYKANGADAGANFLLRFSALSVPVGVNLAIAGHLVGQAVYWGSPYILGRGLFRDPDLVYRYITFITPVAFAFIYYWRISVHIASIKGFRVSESSKIAA
jgi:hypothetical protein